MARLYLFAEGQTELTFAATVLMPHLANSGVYMTHRVPVANSKKKGKIYRGGVRKYEPMKNDIMRFLAQEKADDVFFTTMIDLYAIPSNFPGLAEAEKLRHTPDRRVEALEQAFAKDIPDRRFVPYIQLHEYEAYLFSDPTCFRYFYDHHEKEIAALKAIADSHDTPEEINDRPHKSPSKRIIDQLPDYEGAKPAIGPLVAEQIGLDVIRSKCPHFASWLSRLEKLGTNT